MIEVKDVSKHFLFNKAIKHCTINIGTGKIIGLVGANGSGKTTFLQLLAGLLKPTKGIVTVDGNRVDRKISSKLAYSSDVDHYYFPYFLIRDLIYFYSTQFADFDKRKADTILDFMNLNQKEKIKYLSKGNRNRLKIAVTLARNAPYIILDEPFSGLDPMVRKAILKGLIQFVDLEKQTLLLTTHEVREVEPVLDEVVVMKAGEIVAHRSVDAIRLDYGLDVTEWMETFYQK